MFSSQVLKTSVEGIIRLVVHDEFVVHEVETVRPGLVGTRHHLANCRRTERVSREKRAIPARTEGRRLTEVVGKLRELVDVFARVAAVGDAEAEVEVEALEQPSLEVVPLDHAEAVDGSVAHRELHTGGNKHSQRACERSGRSSRRPASPISSVHSRCPDGAEFEERWRELVAHEAARAGVRVGAVFFALHRT